MRPHDDEGKSDVWWSDATASFFEADGYRNASVETLMVQLAIDTAAARLLEPSKSPLNRSSFARVVDQDFLQGGSLITFTRSTTAPSIGSASAQARAMRSSLRLYWAVTVW